MVDKTRPKADGAFAAMTRGSWLRVEGGLSWNVYRFIRADSFCEITHTCVIYAGMRHVPAAVELLSSQQGRYPSERAAAKLRRDWFLVGGSESCDGRELPAVTEAVTFSRSRRIPGWKGQPEDIRFRPRPPRNSECPEALARKPRPVHRPGLFYIGRRRSTNFQDRARSRGGRRRL